MTKDENQQVVESQPEVVAVSDATVPQMLREFSNQVGCEEYKKDRKRIELLMTYLWLRQLTPALSFEQFLSLFAPLADFNDENRKHPEASLKHHCPRAKGAAEKLGKVQWTAQQCVEYTTLYIDMIREAEATGQAVELSYDDFLPLLAEQFLQGDFAQAPEPKADKKKSTSTRKTTIVLPTTAGQRVVYTIASDNGRQIRGVITEVVKTEGEDSRMYVTVKSDAGELFENVSQLHCHVIDDPTPAEPINQETGEALPVLGTARLTISKVQYAHVKDALQLNVAVGTVAVGDTLWPYSASFDNELEAMIDVVNSADGPYVDANLIDLKQDDAVLAELPPRRNIDGTYTFVVGDGVYVVEVTGRG